MIRPVLGNSARASQAFTRAWSRLPTKVARNQLADAWGSEPLAAARQELRTSHQHQRRSLTAKSSPLSSGQRNPLILTFGSCSAMPYAFLSTMQAYRGRWETSSFGIVARPITGVFG